MSDISLNQILALNEEMAALAELGIPSNLAPDAPPEVVKSKLKEIDASLSLRSGFGQPLVTAAAENHDLPPIYRSALEAGLHGNQLTTTLDGLSRQATADNELRSTFGRSMIPPLIIVTLCYFGFIFLCLYFSPKLESMYTQVGQPPSFPLQVLVLLREGLPVWATLVPIGMLVAIALWRRGRGDWQRLIPGARRYAETVRNANFAQQLAQLLESGVSLTESWPVAAAVTGDETLVASANALASDANLTAKSKGMEAYPPLLRWALTGELGNQSLPEILRFAEKTYRQSAERRAAIWRFALPTIIGAVLGGAFVLAYGLSLFGPLIQLLEDLAR